MTAEDVRSARVALARALPWSGGTIDEAADQLQRALRAPGDVPGDWEIAWLLGQVHRLQRDGGAPALAALIQAVRLAPPTDQRGPADDAIRLLETADAADLVARLDDDAVDGLVQSQRDAGSGAGVRLGARLLLARDSFDEAYDLVRTRPRDDVEGDRLLRVARMVGEARELLASGRPDEAKEVLAEALDEGGSDPSALSALAMCDYVAGDPAAAVEVAASAGPTLDALVVVVLAHLARAAMLTGTERTAAYEAAERAALQAGRVAPTRVEPLLLRGQLLIENPHDGEEGRHLLHNGLRRLDGQPERLWWWPLQTAVRDDDRYRCYLVEVAATLHRPETVVDVAERMTFRITTFLQDALVHEHWAQAERGRGTGGRWVELMKRAASDFTAAGIGGRAIATLRAVVAEDADVDTALDLVDKMWTASFGQDGESPWEAGRLDEGLALLDRVDGQLSGAGAVRACLLRGLVVGRRLALAEPWSQGLSWRQLPYLVLAAEGGPADSYSSAHLAWALSDCDIVRAAGHYAQRALAHSPDDAWIQETALAMEINWWGRLDDDATALLHRLRASRNDPADTAWEDAVAAFARLLNEQPGPVPDITLTERWAQLVAARSKLLAEGIGPSWVTLEKCRQDHETAGELDTAADLALLLDPPAVPGLVRRCMERGSMMPYQERLVLALHALVVGDGAAPLDPVVGYLERIQRPHLLRDFISVIAPCLVAAHPELRGLSTALAALVDIGRERLAAVDATMPSLTVEVDSGFVRAVDPATQDLVHRMLDAVGAAQVGRGTEAREVLSALPLTGLAQAARAAAQVWGQRLTEG